MRKLAIIAIAATALTIAACSKEDRQEIGDGASAAGGEIKDAAGDIADNPDVKAAGAAIGDAGEKAAGAVKDAAVTVQEGVADASEDARRKAESAKAEHDAKEKAH